MRDTLRDWKRKMRFARSEFTYLFLSGRDPDVRELLKLQTASGYLDKRYVTPYFKQNHTDICGNLPRPLKRELVRTAWIYWAQGMQRAPYIVQKCVDSAQRAFRAKGWEVKILDLETVKRYVSLPAYVWDKYKAGMITDAYLSDLIRVCLLTGQGGGAGWMQPFFSQADCRSMYTAANCLRTAAI